MKHLTIILIVLVIQRIYGTNVLFLSDLPSPSHQIWNYEIASALISKGYNVTFFGASPLKGSGQKNYHTIDIEGLTEAIHTDIDVVELITMSTFDNLLSAYDGSYIICNYTLNSDGLQFMLNYPKDFFSLIIVDHTSTSCLTPLVQHFKYPPTVAVTAYLLPGYLSEQFGNPIQPSYIPFISSKYDKGPSFFKRLEHYFYHRLDTFLRTMVVERTLQNWAKERYGPDMDSLRSIDDHMSLLLCNIVPGLSYSQPLTQNIIPVGGLHINSVGKLPEEFQKIIDKSKDGIILFALGTNIDCSHLEEGKKKAILDALGQLKQTVIWKFDKELDNLPKNVIIKKWLPQREILAHPDTKLFISHGGALGLTESMYFGVPVLGIPFFGDQRLNVQLIVNKELGLAENYPELTSATFLNKMNELLSNPLYSQNAKKMSRIIRDQPETPIERVLFWLEYAIRHNGTHFLDPASRHLPLLVSSSTDILLFILFLVIILGVIIKKFVYFLKHNCFSNKSSKKLKKH